VVAEGGTGVAAQVADTDDAVASSRAEDRTGDGPDDGNKSSGMGTPRRSSMDGTGIDQVTVPCRFE
jgi:hypothetical protein